MPVGLRSGTSNVVGLTLKVMTLKIETEADLIGFPIHQADM